MIRKLINTIRLWFARRRREWVRQRIAEWNRDARKLTRVLESRRRRLDAVLAQIKLLGETVAEDMEEVERMAQRQQGVVEAIGDKLQILEEITIPTLEANCRFFQQRYDAEVAVQVRRQVAASPESE